MQATLGNIVSWHLKENMKAFHFNLLSDEDVILVNASLEGKYKFRRALDTAATHTTFEVQVYDFLAHGIASDYDGVIGLNFFTKNKF